MGNIVRTAAQLLARFIVNQVGAIVPQDDDDFIATTFGWGGSPRNPGPNDDSANSSGVGAYFDTGSRWLNPITGQWFKCLSGTPHAAVWRGQAYDGETVGGRLAGTFPNPVLTATGVTPGAYGDSNNYATFSVQADGTLLAAGQFPLSLASRIFGTVVSEWPPQPTLSGLPEWSPGLFLPDGAIYWTGQIGNSVSMGPWIIHPGAWQRPTWWASGTVFDDVAAVWVLTGDYFGVGGVAALKAVSPSATILGPTPWTVDTDPPPNFDYVVPGTEIILPSDTFIEPVGLPLGQGGTVTLQNQLANTFWRGPNSGSPLPPVWGPIVLADLPSGYPYSELSGAPGAVSVSPGTNVSVSSVGGVYTVSVPTFPYSDLTGAPGATIFGHNDNVHAAGTTLATATALTVSANTVTTSTPAVATGVLLPDVYQDVLVYNTSGNTINVYPPNASEQIGTSRSLGQAASILTGNAVTFRRVSATLWYTSQSQVPSS
jgi:hypothetical protein